MTLIFSDSSSDCTTQRLFGKFTLSYKNKSVTDLSGGNNFLPERGTSQGLLKKRVCGWFSSMIYLSFVDEPKDIEFSEFKRSK